MPWADLLQPDLTLTGNILSLGPEVVEQHRLRGLILDVDETLVPWQSTQVPREVIAWGKMMRQLVPLVLVSNNLNRHRIAQIAAEMGPVAFFHGAGKPSRQKVRAAVSALSLDPDRIHKQVGIVGDRLLTDVLVGNRLDMFTILVEPITIAGASQPTYSWRRVEFWLFRTLQGR